MAIDEKLGTENLEKLKGTNLDPEDREKLLLEQTEATFVFTDEEGWPRGIIMSYIWDKGRFWFTAVEGRRHAVSAERDGRVSVVVTSKGDPARMMVSFRGRCTVHRDRETVDWFLHEFTHRLQPQGPDVWRTLLDSPNRVVFEVEPVGKPTTHDQRKLPGNGRGLDAEPQR
jgi:general stress protein 26